MRPSRHQILFIVFVVTILVLLCVVAALMSRPKDGEGDGAATAATVQATPQTIIHVVQAGETLSLIAKQYGISLETLVALNDIPDVDRIEVGQELVVSAPPDWTPSPTATP